MFYSPKKDIERYVTFKNQEIKTLKQQLEEEKVTEENFFVAKKKLEKVKNQRDILLAEDVKSFLILASLTHWDSGKSRE